MDYVPTFLRKDMAKKRHQNKLTKHHIIPRSRGGFDNLENICKVRDRDHRLYHALYDNKTPKEIVEYMVETFWGGDYSFLNRE